MLYQTPPGTPAVQSERRWRCSQRPCGGECTVSWMVTQQKRRQERGDVVQIHAASPPPPPAPAPPPAPPERKMEEVKPTRRQTMEEVKPTRRPLVRAASEESSSDLSSVSWSPSRGDTLPWNLPKHHRMKRSKSASGEVMDPAERAVIRIAGKFPQCTAAAHRAFQKEAPVDPESLVLGTSSWLL
ncbi:unnamed protein product [Pleuronectes platessa]|uniref:Uncharacterized protein n=1 Tax=Pleuronectes platessa TaxID=8262 RepID=A0A9N7UDN8_PLEPL|nr:unnamed protein product [Pleuronectes platessa]